MGFLAFFARFFLGITRFSLRISGYMEQNFSQRGKKRQEAPARQNPIEARRALLSVNKSSKRKPLALSFLQVVFIEAPCLCTKSYSILNPEKSAMPISNTGSFTI